MRETIILCIIIFILVFFISLIINLNKAYSILTKKEKKRKKKKEIIIMEIKYLTLKFDLEEKKLLKRKVLAMIAFLNALIISLDIFIVILIDINPGIQLAIGFILAFGLIYSLYELYGRFLAKGGYKNEHK